MKLLVIIPAYNEQDCIVETVSELRRTIPGVDYVVVNDGSKDDTKKLCLEHEFNLIDLPVNIGLTGGFQAGMKYALRNGYDAAVQFDADGQHVPSYIEALAAEMERSNADIVIGSRFVTEKKSASLRMIGSRLIAAITKITTGASISDPTSGLRMYNRANDRGIQLEIGFRARADSIAYLARKGAKIREVQVSMRERQAGESYLTFTRSIEYMMRTCISILFVQWFRS